MSFTFTEKAADELKGRIRRILQDECPDRADFGDMYVGTIHGYCFKLLKDISPVYRSFDVLDDPMRIAWLNKYENYYDNVHLEELREHHAGIARYRLIDLFVASADIVMTEDVDLDMMSDTESNTVFRKCYEAYRETLRKDKYFDFTSIMKELVDLLKRDSKAMKKATDQVKHVTVDEYQDVNSVQESLVEILSKGAKSVCAVGDDDQNIYNWRGSNVGIIRNFKKKYSKTYKVSEIALNINYRSTPEIISTCRGFIENNEPNRLSKAMTHNEELGRKYKDGDIVHMHFETEEEEFGFIVRKIRDLIGTDFTDKRNNKFSLSFGNIVVLVRSNYDGARLTQHFAENNIEAVSYGGQSVFEKAEVIFAMDCIAYVFGCKSYTDSFSYEMDELEERYRGIFPTDRFPQASVKKFAEKLERIRNNAALKLSKKPKDYLGGLGLQEYYHNILNAMGAETFDMGKVYNYNFAVLSDAVSDYEMVYQRLRASQVEGFVWFVTSFVKSKYSETIHNDPTIQDAVNVMTIHKAKGLEFPVVFVPCFYNRRGMGRQKPFVEDRLYNSSMYDGNEQDDRRTYYTAMTRSEKYLFITGSATPGKLKKRKPHRFMQEIPSEYFSRRLHPKMKASGYDPMPLNDVAYSTSFSELNSYDRCPKDFQLRHMYGFNAGVPPGFGYGTNLHNILNMIFNDFMEKKIVPTESQIKTMFDKVFKLRYAPGKMSEGMREKAENIIKRYVELNKQDFNRVLTTEKNFEFVIGKTLISGQIDLLMKVDENGNETGVEIIDFKSEEKTEGEYQMDHEKQLRYYALACKDSLDMNPSSAWVHHLSETDPAKRKSQVDISDSVLDDTKTGIDHQVANVLTRKFDAKPRNKEETCNDCDYQVICPMKSSAKGLTLPDVGNVQKKTSTADTSTNNGLSDGTMKKAKNDARNVTVIDDRTFEVVSSGSGKKYTIVDGKCTCLGFRNFYKNHSGKRTCSHLEAIKIFKNSS